MRFLSKLFNIFIYWLILLFGISLFAMFLFFGIWVVENSSEIIEWLNSNLTNTTIDDSYANLFGWLLATPFLLISLLGLIIIFIIQKNVYLNRKIKKLMISNERGEPTSLQPPTEETHFNPKKITNVESMEKELDSQTLKNNHLENISSGTIYANNKNDNFHFQEKQAIELNKYQKQIDNNLLSTIEVEINKLFEED